MEHEHAVSLTTRAVKKALPERAILTKDGRTMLNTASSMFTLFLATTAHDIAAQNKRQTIMIKDVYQALKSMDFDDFIGPIEDCLRDTKARAAMKKARSDAERSADPIMEEEEPANADDMDETMQEEAVEDDAENEAVTDEEMEPAIEDDTSNVEEDPASEDMSQQLGADSIVAETEVQDQASADQ